jgi:hypothetical protein
MLHALVLLAHTATIQSPAPAPAEPSLRLESTIELADVAGRIDHLALDRARGRLYVAALENGSVEVVDLKARTRVKRFTGLAEPQGIVFLEKPDRVAFACGGSGTLELLDAQSLEPAGKVEIGPDADNVRYHAAHERVVVAYGGGGLAVVDASTWKVERRIELGAHPESFQLDARGRTAFVNLPSSRAAAIVVYAPR